MCKKMILRNLVPKRSLLIVDKPKSDRKKSGLNAQVYGGNLKIPSNLLAKKVEIARMRVVVISISLNICN